MGKLQSTDQRISLPGHLQQLLTVELLVRAFGRSHITDTSPLLQQCLTKALIPGWGPEQGNRSLLDMSYVHGEAF